MRKLASHYKYCVVKVIYSFIIASFIFCSHLVLAEQNDLGPRFEIGVGVSGSQMHSQPEWISKLYTSGILNVAYRIAYGLSIQGGKNFGYGQKKPSEWFNYGNHAQINIGNGTYDEGSWLGTRYEIPMSTFNKDIAGIHTIYLAGGLTWEAYGIRGDKYLYYPTENGWEVNEVPETKTSESSFKTADLTGYYVTVAARWRVKTAYTEEMDSWLGSYGLDIGMRYARYPNCKTKYDNIVTAKSNYNYYQFFIVVFLKLRFLY